MSEPDWNDARYFLAAATEGSFAAAAKRLGVEHTTVARRVSRLEEQAGAKLVTRTREGVALTPAGAAMRERLRTVEAALNDAFRSAAAFDRAVEGVVRISTSEIFAAGFLCEQLLDLRRLYPLLRIELPVGIASVNLAKREADLAVRLMPESKRPDDPELLAKKVGRITFSLYAARAYLAARPLPPGRVDSLQGHTLLHYDRTSPRAVAQSWLAARDAGAEYALKTTTIPVLLAATVAGMGLAVLPDFLARRVSSLVPLTSTLETSAIWLLVHPDARRVRRVATVHKWLTRTTERHFGSA